jgi:Cu+-exporting ATPase
METKIVINVGGMHCVNCAKSIETALLKIKGVRRAVVAFAHEKADVVIDPGLVPIDALKNAVESSGFQFLGIDGQTDQEALDEKKKRFLRMQLWKFIVGFMVGAALMATGLITTGLSPHALMLAQFIIATPVFLVTGFSIFKAAVSSLRNLSLTMDVMYALGMGTAYIASVMATFSIVLSPQFMFFDTSVLLAAFLTLGRYLETRARSRTSSAIRSLMDLRPKTAFLLIGNEPRETPVETIVAGNRLLVRPGDAFPVDGIVLSGESSVDESMISGESFPLVKKKDDSVIAGTINKNGVLTITTTKVGRETMLARIIELVSDAQNSRPPIQKTADRAVSWFIPSVLAAALLSFLLWLFIAGAPLLFALTACISVLVVACPCALGLATPTALSVGLGRAATMGVLIKSGDALELSEKISTVVFDKTGTLTKGAPEVLDILPVSGDPANLLSLAASIEQYSRHPLAMAILRKAADMGSALKSCDAFTSLEGEGVIGVIDGKETVAGNAGLLNKRGIEVTSGMRKTMEELSCDGKIVALFAREGALCGLIACADALKPTSHKAIEALHAMRIKTVMMSGDNEKTAVAVARLAGIETVYAGLLPTQKAEHLKELQQGGERVAFVGDGINDAVALAQADVGIALGAATDVAIESADIVLMNDDCMDVAAALQLGKAVMRRIRLNLFWAFAYNAALIPFAAGIAYPAFHVLVRPEWAGLAMAMSSVTVVLLSLGLKNYMPPIKKQTSLPNPEENLLSCATRKF